VETVITAIILSSIGFYILMAFIIGRMTYNHYIEIEYRKQMKKLGDKPDINILKRYHPEVDTAEEYALIKAKVYSPADENCMFAGIFWLIAIWWLIAVKAKNSKKLAFFMKSKVEKEVEGSLERIQNHKNLLNTIQQAKSAGIDTRELEQLAKSYKS
jgi:Trk-type K+ transport system membrane component